MPKPKKCTKKTIAFKTKRGRKISFTGHSGESCPKRKKPSTAHLKVYKAVMKDAAPQCFRKSATVKAARRCVGDAIKAVARSNRR